MAQGDSYTDHSRLPNVPFTFKALQTITGVGIGCGVGIGIGRAMELRNLPIVGPALGGSGEINRVFQSIRGPVRNAIMGLGFKQLNAGIGCGVGIGHGFGIGFAVKPEVATKVSEAIKTNLAKWMARFESRMSTPQNRIDLESSNSLQSAQATSSTAVSPNPAKVSTRYGQRLTAKDVLEAEIADSDILKLVLIKVLRQEAVNEALKQIVIENVEPDIAFHSQGIELANTSFDLDRRRKCFKCRRKERLR